MAHQFAELAAALEGRYAIERELGRGGMATVYLAGDLRLHRQVAIKLLRPELAATLGPERFQREISIASRLAHPNILKLYDAGTAGGRVATRTPAESAAVFAGDGTPHRARGRTRAGVCP